MGESLRQKLLAFKSKLQNWRDGKLKRYDGEASVRADRNKKYHNRPGYVGFLDKTISEKLDVERSKMQSKCSFDADLSLSPSDGDAYGPGADDDGDEVFHLEEVSRE